jgi:hypothetical protein
MDKEQSNGFRSILLLELGKEPCGLAFEKEINSFEFVEAIGGMDLSLCTKQKKRDLYLTKIGKKLFREYPERKNRIGKIHIEYETRVFSQAEIESMLFTVDEYKKLSFKIKIIFNKIKRFSKNIFQWKLIIPVNNVEYKICLKGIKKTRILSQAEIESLLLSKVCNNAGEIKNSGKEVLSQAEIDMVSTSLDKKDDTWALPKK